MLSFDTRDPLDDLPTKAELQTAIDGIPAVDLSDLPTKAELQTAIDGIPATDLSNLPTKTELQTAIDGIPATDLSNLPTNSELQTAIDGIPATDLSNLPTKAELAQQVSGLSRRLGEMPTQEQLQTAVNGGAANLQTSLVRMKGEIITACSPQPIFIPPYPDISLLPTKGDLAIAINNRNLPDLTNLPTKSDLTAAINNIPIAHLPTNAELENALRTATSNLPSKFEVRAELLAVSNAVSAAVTNPLVDLKSRVQSIERTLPADPAPVSMFTNDYTAQTAPESMIALIKSTNLKVTALTNSVNDLHSLFTARAPTSGWGRSLHHESLAEKIKDMHFYSERIMDHHGLTKKTHSGDGTGFSGVGVGPGDVF